MAEPITAESGGGASESGALGEDAGKRCSESNSKAVVYDILRCRKAMLGVKLQALVYDILKCRKAMLGVKLQALVYDILRCRKPMPGVWLGVCDPFPDRGVHDRYYSADVWEKLVLQGARAPCAQS